MATTWIAAVGCIFGLGLTAILVWAITPATVRLGLLDRPNARKEHAQPTPVTGGIAMLVATLLTFVIVLRDASAPTLAFGLGALLLTVQGVLDDKYDLSWRLRIVVEVVAALILVYLGGVRVDYLGDVFGFGPVSLGLLAVPFTVFAVVGIINAVNMIDGADGLAGSLVLAALVMLGAAADYAGNTEVLLRVAILIGVVAGFLIHNLRFPGRAGARVFMGNSGSALLGFVIAFFSFRLTQNPAHPVGPILALWLIPIPIMDCLVLIVRRLRLGRSPFAADRNHIHHLMLEGGFGPMRTVLALVGFSFACGLAAAVTLRWHLPQVVLAAAFVMLCIGYFGLTSKRVRAVAFFRRLRRLPVLPAAEIERRQRQPE